MYQFDFSFFVSELQVAFTYIPVTLLLACVPMVVGLVIGGLLAAVRVQHVPIASQLIALFVLLVRSLPIILLLLVSYYGFTGGFDALTSMLDLSINSAQVPILIIAIVVLCIIAIAFLTETMRAAFQSVDTGQIEAARSEGMTVGSLYRRVIVPQALPMAIPILGNVLIGLIQGSALVYIIGVVDLLNATKIQANINYRYIEAYLAAALVYWFLCFLIEKASDLLSQRVNRSIGW